MSYSPNERLSPDGRYKLISTPIPQAPGCWNVLSIEVRRTEDNALIGTTTRNFHDHEILHFVAQDGVDYLVISENYHGGHGVMNLATGEKAVYDPEDTPHEKNQQFWCWAAPVSHDPASKELVIAWCYWACPYDRITFDFSNPMAPPYPILLEFFPFPLRPCSRQGWGGRG